MRHNKLIAGAHVIIYSRKPEADRVFLRDILGLTHVDAGEGWLIFALPATELAVHPSTKNNKHELYFICSDVHAVVADLQRKNVPCSKIQSLGWGDLTQVTLPGGGKVGIYQPRHARPRTPPRRRLTVGSRTPRKSS